MERSGIKETPGTVGKWVNESAMDRLIRTVIGLGLLAVALFGRVGIGWAVLAAGGILLLTGITGVCPLYRVMGVNTRKVSRRAS